MQAEASAAAAAAQEEAAARAPHRATILSQIDLLRCYEEDPSKGKENKVYCVPLRGHQKVVEAMSPPGLETDFQDEMAAAMLFTMRQPTGGLSTATSKESVRILADIMREQKTAGGIRLVAVDPKWKTSRALSLCLITDSAKIQQNAIVLMELKDWLISQAIHDHKAILLAAKWPRAEAASCLGACKTFQSDGPGCDGTVYCPAPALQQPVHAAHLGLCPSRA